jgi:hypothetical protein
MLHDNAIRIVQAQSTFFDRAVTFIGRPRERLVALMEAERICVLLYPYHYRSLQLIRIATDPSLAGERYRKTLENCESNLLFQLRGIIRDAMMLGDLDSHEIPAPGELSEALWACAFRTHTLMNLAIPTPQTGASGFLNHFGTATTLLDGIGWSPLSREWDYEATRDRVRREVFAEELARLPRSQAVPVCPEIGY